MIKSKPTNIKGKEVDFKVVNSSNDLNDNDHGRLGIVIRDNDYNSVYVGNTHIASGYGFDSLSKKESVEDLIANENIQKVARGEFNPGNNQQPSEGSEVEIETTIEDSFIYYNGEKIKIEDGKLGKELYKPNHTWIEISNVKIKAHIESKVSIKSYDVVLNSLDYKECSIFDEITIKEVEFDYIINSGIGVGTINEIYYTIHENEVDKNYKYQINALTKILESGDYDYNAKGNIKIEDVNKTITNNSDLKTINLYFSDLNRNNIIYIPICNFKFTYPIFGASSDDESFISIFSNPLTYDSDFFEYGVEPNENNEYLIKVGNNNNHVFHYILIPNKYSEDNISIILKSSNIGCDFESKEIYSIDNNIYYKIYKSPRSYKGQLYWVVKIW